MNNLGLQAYEGAANRRLEAAGLAGNLANNWWNQTLGTPQSNQLAAAQPLASMGGNYGSHYSDTANFNLGAQYPYASYFWGGY